MLSLDKMRKVDPQLVELSDEELGQLRTELYDLAQLAFDVWWKRNGGSKNPVRSFPSLGEDGTV